MFKIDEIVEKNIKENGKNMKLKFAKKMSKQKLPPLDIGDYCRIDTRALKQTRKLSQIDRGRLRKHRELNNFTKEVYEIVNVVEFPDDDGKEVPKYYLTNTATGENINDKSFYREQLLKVKSDEIIPIQGERFGGSDIKVDTNYYGLADEVDWDDLKVPDEDDLKEDIEWELDEKHNESGNITDEPTIDYDTDIDDDDIVLPLILQDERGKPKKKQLDYAHFAKTGEKRYK